LDLKGASMEDLKKIPSGGKIPGLDKISSDNDAFPYKDYVQLSAVGDGNCFLNSFSVLLTGKERDTSLALPLRVKLCLEFMANPDKFAGGNETQQLDELKEKLNGSYGFAKNGNYTQKDVISAKNIEDLFTGTPLTLDYPERENVGAELHFEFEAGLSVHRLYKIVETINEPGKEITKDNKLLKEGQRLKIVYGKMSKKLVEPDSINYLNHGKGSWLLGKIRMNLTRRASVRSTLSSAHQGKQEIPQIKSGVVVIHDILRLPGLVSKVLVERSKGANEKRLNIDPAGTCIGERGERAKSISRLIYERIDFADDYLGIKIHDRVLEGDEKDEILTNKGQVLQEIGNYKNIGHKKVIDERDNLLLEIVRQNVSKTTNELKNNILYLIENVTVAELGEIIAKGQIISHNQPLSWDLLTDYCQNIKIEIKKKSGINFNQIIQEYLKKDWQKGQLVARPPVVSIMGHIDHGKTTLLDTIRQTQVQKKEIGGITQKVSASQIEFQNQKITFLDTPGHSDFIKMRQRGISLTDLVVLVIDAKDGVMEQTKEIINYLLLYELPVIVFINHKKLTETNHENNLNRIRVSGSARETTSIQNLLEVILLFSVDFKTEHSNSTHGVVIDSYLHSQTGSRISELLIQNGELKAGDIIFLSGKFGKAKMIFGLHGQKTTVAYPSDLVQVIGLNAPAELGDRFLVLSDEKAVVEIEKELVEHWGKKKKITSPSSEKKNVNLVLAADSQNSLEALTELIKKKTTANLNFSVVQVAMGSLNSFALDLARITNSTVLIFGYQPSQREIKTLKEDKISFFSSKIIYEIGDKLDEIISSQREVEEVEEIVGTATVKKVFHFSKGNIAGCQVVSGKINRNKQVYVLQGKEGKKIFSGEIKTLEINKVEKKEVSAGQECGIVLKGFNNFQEKDKIVSFHLIKRNVIQEK
ncbi:16667_t:CDS:10, partial [Funneliformis geosporum]